MPDYRNLFLAVRPHPLYPKIWFICLVNCEIEYHEIPGIPFYDFISSYDLVEDQG